MMGFGSRATVVKIRHTDLFRHTQRTKSVPEFKALLKCQTIEEIMQLPVTNEKISIDFYALLPPCLSEEIFEAEDLSPGAILLLFINKINALHIKQQHGQSDDGNGDITEGDTATANDQTSTSADTLPDEQTDTASNQQHSTEISTTEETNAYETDQDEAHSTEPSYSRILNFLYECIKEPRVVQDVIMHPCTKQSTSDWLDHQHTALLQSTHTSVPQPPQTSQTHNLIASIGSLTAAMADRHLRDMDAKPSKTTDILKKFDALALITKNTTILCITMPNMDQDELHEIEPTAAWSSLIGQKSSTTIVRTIEHTMSNRGCMVYLQKGTCNDFRHGTIASSPDPFARNGLCVFLMAPEETKRVKEDRLRELEEKSRQEQA